MTTETNWEETRHGGYRRQRTRVAQKMGTQELEDRGTEAEGSAEPEVEEAWTPGSTSEERLGNTKEAVGSSPAPRTKKFQFHWRERLGLDTCPYLIRWRLETPWGSVRLHHWLSHDDPRHVHDHPWNFITFVLKGSYLDVSTCRACGGQGADAVANGIFPCTDCNGTGQISQYLCAPAVQYRDATHRHTVYPEASGCWTVIITGPKIRPWGFWVNGKFKKMNKYFLTFGHHPCD